MSKSSKVELTHRALSDSIGLSESVTTTKTLGRRFLSMTGRITRKARCPAPHLPQGWPWQNQFDRALARLRPLSLLS